MKITGKPILLLVLLILSPACMFIPKIETPMPTLVPYSNTPQPTATVIATEAILPSPTATVIATEVPLPAPIATEVPVDIHAPYNENAVPGDDIAKALEQSKNDGKLVLLDFGANWCPDCLVLTVLFEDPAVKPFLEENYHVVRIDIGMGDKNLDVSEKYDNPINKGIPAVVVLAPEGEIIATTKDGSLANARTATAQEILGLLKQWLVQKP
jgi:thiol-disulfide isomerase/thioredoxin